MGRFLTNLTLKALMESPGKNVQAMIRTSLAVPKVASVGGLHETLDEVCRGTWVTPFFTVSWPCREVQSEAPVDDSILFQPVLPAS